MNWWILLILVGFIGYLIGRIQENLISLKALKRAMTGEQAVPRRLSPEMIDAIAESYVGQAFTGMPFSKWPEADAALMKKRLAKAFSEAISGT